MKKLLSLAIVLVMSFAAFSAFAEDKVITIEVLTDSKMVDETKWEDNFVEQQFREKLGVDVIWNYSDAFNTTLTMRTVSGDMPDIFILPNRSYIAQYAEEGLILNLSDYADRLPDAFAFVEDNIVAGKINGEVYAIPSRPYTLREATWYNAVLFEKLGYTKENLPKTLHEFIDVVREIMASDPDGNGINDTIGLTGRNWEAFQQLLGAYGCTIPNTLSLDAKDQVQDTMLGDKYFEALEYIAALWSEGVIDHEVFALSSAQVTEKAMTGKAITIQEEWPSVKKEGSWKNFTDFDANAKWEIVGPLEGPYGDNYVGKYGSQTFTRLYGVSAHLADDKEKLAAALRLLNYTATEEGLDLISYGIHGTHWEYDERGYAVIDPAYTQEVNFTWVYQLCGRDELEYCYTKFGEVAWEYIVQSSEQPYIDDITMLMEKPEWYNDIDCETYITEEITNFITGERALTKEEWDSFISTLENTYQYSKYITYANDYYHSLKLGN